MKLIEEIPHQGVVLCGGKRRKKQTRSAVWHGCTQIGRQTSISLISASELTLTCSPSAHPPQNRTQRRDHRSPNGALINRYCAPPRRKQCVENLPGMSAPASAPSSNFCTLSCASGTPGWSTPFHPTMGNRYSSSVIMRPRWAYLTQFVQKRIQKNRSHALPKSGRGYIL